MPDFCTVVAVFTPKPEFVSDVREVLYKVTPLVHDEPGCIFYTMNEDGEGHFVHIEAWATRQDWIDHMEQPTVKEILETVEGKLQREVEVYELYNVQTGTSGKGSLAQAEPAGYSPNTPYVETQYVSAPENWNL